MLTDADSFTTPTKSVKPPTFVLLYFFLRSPKHQLGLNLVWPGIMNESVISLCWPVITLHSRYCTMVAFLFCPPVVSVQVYSLLTQSVVCKEVVEHADDGVGALPHVDSFINEVTDVSGNGLAAYSKNCTLSRS